MTAPVAEIERLLLFVRDEERRDPDAPDDAFQLPPRALAQGRIEVGERLVEQEDARLRRERARDRHALLLASGDLTDAPPLEPRQIHGREGLGDAAFHVRPRHLLRLQAERDVFSDAHVRKERVVLEDHADLPPVRGHPRDVLVFDAHAPGIGRLESRDEAQHRRLAAPGRSEQCHDLALSDRKGDVGRDTQAAETLLEVVEVEEGFVICDL
jgi:hypothetical protein